MVNLCNFCSQPLINENGIFICENGHIATYTQEVTELPQSLYGAAQRTIKPESTKISDGELFRKIFVKLYLIIKEYYGFKNDLVLKIFFSYWENDDFYLTNYYYFYAIIYYSVRVYHEKNNEIFTFTEFRKSFPTSLYMYYYNHYGCKYELHKRRYLVSFEMVAYDVKIDVVHSVLRFFGQEQVKNRTHGIYTTTSDKNYNSENKRIFRLIVRRDHETMVKYLNTITAQFNIDCTEEMKQAFTKFTDLYLIEKRVFIPDLIICTFLAVYIMNVKTTVKFSVVEAAITNNETAESKFNNEMEELQNLRANNGDILEYKRFRSTLNKSYLQKDFIRIRKPLPRLIAIFSFYLKLPVGQFYYILNYTLLFIDACKNQMHYNQFYYLEMRDYVKSTTTSLTSLVRSKYFKYLKSEEKKCTRLIEKLKMEQTSGKKKRGK